MAKSKSKKSKSKSKKKATQHKKNVASKKNGVKKSAPVKTKKTEVKHEDIQTATIKNKNTRTGIMVLLAFAVFFGGLFMGMLLSEQSNLKEIESSAEPSPIRGQSTIEVTEPSSNTQESTGYGLQGNSKDNSQNAQGGLQKPQNVDQLQPNARIQDYENANLE